MTLSERLRQLEEDKLKKSAYSINPPLPSDIGFIRRNKEEEAEKLFARYTTDNLEQKNERQNHYQRLIQEGNVPPEYIESRKRDYLYGDLFDVGFKTFIYTSKDAVFTLFAENQLSASTAFNMIKDILTANPTADLQSYEEDLCVMILRIDKSDVTPQPERGGYIDV